MGEPTRLNYLKTFYRTVLSLPFLFLFLFSSCDSITDGREKDDLTMYHDLWEKKNLSHYSFEYSKLCYCAGLFNPARIVVKADTIHSVLDPVSGEPLRDPYSGELVFPNYSESFLTINDLFEIIDNARTTADKLKVEYHEDLGYPVNVEIDYMRQAIDDEVTYKIGNFEPEQ